MTDSLDPSGDEWEIRQLVEAYAAAADHTDGEGLAELFTTDGVLEIWMDPASSDSTGRRTGRGEIVAAINGLARYRATHHTISSSLATIDGDTARGETTCEAHHIEADDTGARDRVLYLRYDDDYARVEGRWLIRRRELRVKWVSVQPVETT